MEIIKKRLEEVMSRLDEYDSLVEDSHKVATNSLRATIDDMLHQCYSRIKESCESALKHISEVEAAKKQEIENSNTPVFFDVLHTNGMVDPHVGKNGVYPSDTIIRSYNSKNVVLHEDASLAKMCDNYNSRYKRVERQIIAAIAKKESEKDPSECTEYISTLPHPAKAELEAETKEEQVDDGISAEEIEKWTGNDDGLEEALKEVQDVSECYIKGNQAKINEIEKKLERDGVFVTKEEFFRDSDKAAKKDKKQTRKSLKKNSRKKRAKRA